jgi:hypothetical protein
MDPVPEPSDAPTMDPVAEPSGAPSEVPSMDPVPAPSEALSEVPTMDPVPVPSQLPTQAPNTEPEEPVPVPSEAPSMDPVPAPSEAPSKVPTTDPVPEPSDAPTMDPSEAPSGAPSQAPSMDPVPAPSQAPSQAPSLDPTLRPTPAPTPAPAPAPTPKPTPAPVPAVWEPLFYEDFEDSNVVIDPAGGKESKITNKESYGNGDNSLELKKDKDNSMGTSDSFNVSQYSKVKVNFWYYFKDTDLGDSFFLQWNNGSGWQDVKEYEDGVDADEGEWAEGERTWDLNGASSLRLRFRADISEKKVYIDEVRLSAQ